MPRRMPSESSVTGYFQVVETQKVPGMQYRSSIFGNLLKPIDRRQFREIVERHDADAYDKSFKSWDHMVTLVGAQLGCITSLRGLELAFNANSHQHYHLGVCKVARSTLSDANARHEDARRLSSGERCPALHRDDGFDHQRRRDRPSDGTRSRRDLRLRQGLLSFWLVEEDQRYQGFLRHTCQGEHPLAQDEVPVRAQDHRRRLQNHRR